MTLSDGAKAAIVLGGIAATGIAVYAVSKAKATTAPPPSCSCPSEDVCPSSSGSCSSGYCPDPANAGCCATCSPSSCSCPSSDVCQASDGSCPSGYYPDPVNAGCCAVCNHVPCACDEVFDTVLCECSALIPSTIDISPAASAYPFWMLYQSCGLCVNPVGMCTGYEGEINECSFVSGECNDNYLSMSVTGSVVDSQGNPICNVPLGFSTNAALPLSVPWSTPDGNFEGDFVLDASFPLTTDENGNFTITITEKIANVNPTHAGPFSNACRGANSETSFTSPATLIAYVAVLSNGRETSVRGETIILLQNTICEWLNCT